MLFQNGKLKVRELEAKDKYSIVKWLSDPSVLEYYEGRDNPFDLEKVHKKFYVDENNLVRCMVEYDNMVIGYIQYYDLDDEEKTLYGYDGISESIYGMDQFIGEVDYWNRGIGTVLVKSMVAFLIEEKQVDKVVMDPQTWNERALACYEKCGFKKVKILPKNEYHEGEYRDCWLIEYS